MKKLTGLLLLVAFFMFPLYANATIIGNVNLQEYASGPSGKVTFPSRSGTFFLDYDVSLNGGPLLEAFCVEDSNGPGSTPRQYTLLTIDDGLSKFELDPARYNAAAWVAQYYYSNYEGHANEEQYKAGAQIAVWEIIFDYSDFDLANGTFTSSVFKTEAEFIWGKRPDSFPTSSTEWVLAVSPTVVAGDQIGRSDYQNYLVPNPVPEPASMFLFGTGLFGMGAIIRKKFTKKDS